MKHGFKILVFTVTFITVTFITVTFMSVGAAYADVDQDRNNIVTVSTDAKELFDASNYVYKLAPITSMEPGRLGNTRLYFLNSCNQFFSQVIDDTKDGQSTDVGILTKVYRSGCDRAPKMTYATYRAHGAGLNPVTKFDQIIRCSCLCTVIKDGQSYTSSNEGFGTTTESAMNEMLCTGIVSGLQCGNIKVTE